MTQTTTQAHPDLAKPIRTLRCTCCGQHTQGRQFHNQDTGFGLGDCCHDYVKPRVEDMERTYGIHGVHYKLDPVALVREVGQNLADPQVEWRISQNLTDRWGDINRHDEASKPLALLERIISASSNPGDVVLDPFSGCGTCIDAAQSLARESATLKSEVGRFLETVRVA